MAVRLPSLARTTRGVLLAALAAIFVAAIAIAPLRAQDRTTVLRVLRESRDFRARVRAAMALGASADPAMAGPLAGALSDASPAVRAAAAEALGRLGNPDALPSLRSALADREREVRDAAGRAIRAIGGSSSSASSSTPPPAHDPLRMPSVEVVPRERDVDWGSVRYVVVLGDMQNRSGFTHERLQSMLSQEVHRHLLVLRGVAALDGVSPDADREIARRRLPRMRLEGSITRVHRQAHGRDLQVRCEVALMLMDEPGRSIRAALNGAATGMERASSSRAQQEARLAEQALQGAVRSAMSGAARAITASVR
ncbi:HEAT repeat domain-containing protein [Sandaracinus amylolyticus]|uniref:HEAT repeat protein n=1 Tax=Sandaracinus amylolyticus TaxID=927083 RepID=A0A0F6W792_9BACT|nr:HEAT repeat domain-containing protein [Sandaracinus amylolyticus]AKF09198.1 HEAT repeat protein [Sandaracinus amylolyticus]